MEQRKTMKLWQMLVIVILSAGMLVTMFLPAFHFNGNAIKKMGNKLMQSAGVLGDVLGSVASEELDKKAEDFDEEVKQAEEEAGIKISSITPGRIMTHSFASFFGIESSEELSETPLEGVENPYNMLRVLLWIVFVLAILVMLVTVLGFGLQWTKYISLSISAAYGLFATVLFGIWQFLSPGAAAKSIDIGSILENALGNMGSLGNLGGSLDSLITKLISCFWGVAFLIAFIVAVLLLIVSVVSMFVGNDWGSILHYPQNRQHLQRRQHLPHRQHLLHLLHLHGLGLLWDRSDVPKASLWGRASRFHRRARSWLERAGRMRIF